MKKNRMLTADGANGLANSYAYDADGHRTRRSLNNNGEVWWHIYGISGELVAEYQLISGTPTLKKEYGFRNGQLLVIAETTGTWQWLVTDALGTPDFANASFAILSIFAARSAGNASFAKTGTLASVSKTARIRQRRIVRIEKPRHAEGRCAP